MEFITKQGDTRNALKAVLTPAYGDFSDATQIRFRMADIYHRNVIDRLVDVSELPVAIVVFASAEVATPGTYHGEFVVTYGDGKSETFPNKG